MWWSRVVIRWHKMEIFKYSTWVNVLSYFPPLAWTHERYMACSNVCETIKMLSVCTSNEMWNPKICNLLIQWHTECVRACVRVTQQRQQCDCGLAQRGGPVLCRHHRSCLMNEGAAATGKNWLLLVSRHKYKAEPGLRENRHKGERSTQRI